MREEYKLVFLTLLVRLGLGTLFIYIMTSFWVPTAQEYVVTFAALLVTVFGLGLSLLHVGRPGRIMNTFANRKSMMSWEALLAPPLLLATAVLVVFSYLNPGAGWLMVLRVSVLFLIAAFIFVTGKVYHLRARPSWNTPLVLYEYFVSAFILGLLGFALVLVATGNMSENLGQILGFVLFPLLVAEAIITYAFRARAIRATITAQKALQNRSTRRLYAWFVVVGLIAPAMLALMLALGIQIVAIVPVTLGTFLLGAVWWRVLFFRSATLIKITPDIAI